MNEYLSGLAADAGFHKGEGLENYNRAVDAAVLDSRLTYIRLIAYFYEDDSLIKDTDNIIITVQELQRAIHQNIGPVITLHIQLRNIDPNEMKEEDLRSMLSRMIDYQTDYQKKIRSLCKKIPKGVFKLYWSYALLFQTDTSQVHNWNSALTAYFTVKLHWNSIVNIKHIFTFYPLNLGLDGAISDNVGLSEIPEGKDFARELPVKQPIFTYGILV